MIKTLAMLKMEKNFVAVIDKKYPRQPYLKYSTKFLLDRLDDEVKELRQACQINTMQAKDECADVSNIVDYIFERLSQGMRT